MKSTFASLKYYNYRIWFFACLVANLGTWMQRIAQDWLVLNVLTNNSGTAVGITTALQFLPALLLGPLGGLIADRVNRRHLLILTQGSSGVLAIGLGLLSLSGSAQLWQVFCFAFVSGIVSAIDSPVRQTFVAELVPRGKLPNAVGLNSASFNAARLVGPGLAGVLIAALSIGTSQAVGTGYMFILNGISFAATIAAMLFMRKDTFFAMPRAEREKGQVRQGFRYIRRRGDLMVNLIVVGVISAFGLNFQMTMGLMATTVFGKSSDGYGMLGSILAIGSLTGALIAARRERPRVRLVVGSALAFGIFAAVLAVMPSYLTFAIATIPVGFCSLTMLTAANATMQMSSDPRMRGRVMALYYMVVQGATPIGSPIIGWIGSNMGARWSIGVGAVASILVAAAAAIWAARSWKVRVRYRVRPRLLVTVQNPATDVMPVDGGLDLHKLWLTRKAAALVRGHSMATVTNPKTAPANPKSTSANAKSPQPSRDGDGSPLSDPAAAVEPSAADGLGGERPPAGVVGREDALTGPLLAVRGDGVSTTAPLTASPGRVAATRGGGPTHVPPAAGRERH